MTATTWMAFVVAGALGAVARHLVTVWAARRTAEWLPWGTFAVNVTGSLAAGLLSGLVLHHGLAPAPYLVLTTGFCGAYTTFSTFSVESVLLLEQGAGARALANLAGTLVIGVAAAAAGLALASL